MRKQERGFALLLVFAMAAGVAMLLYVELPRAMFESQRSKEQLLVERGEQYQRAIGLYFKKNKKWPQEIKDLEETNGIRYLRHRFKDPLTGKDDWRIIHTNGMQLTDSLVQKAQDPLKAGKDAKGNPLPGGQGGNQQMAGGFGGNSGGFNSGSAGMGGGFNPNPGSNAGFGQPQVVQTGQVGVWNPATGQFGPPAGQEGQQQAWQQRRANDRVLTAPPQQGAQPGAQQPDVPADTNEDIDVQPAPVFAGQPDDPAAGQAGQTTPGQAGNPAGGPIAQMPGQQGFPGAPNAGGQYPGQPGQVPGQPPYQITPTFPAQGQNSGMANTPMGGYRPGGFGGPGGAQDPSQNAALDVIRRSLTQPRPGGMSGLGGMQGAMQPGMQGGMMGGMQGGMMGGMQGGMMGGMQGGAAGMGGMGPGIAGVASKFEGGSIRVYNERKKYQEWEFVYDMTKDPALNPQMGQQQGGMKGSTSNPGFGAFGGGNNSNQNSSFGSSGSSFGNQQQGSSFGSRP